MLKKRKITTSLPQESLGKGQNIFPNLESLESQVATSSDRHVAVGMGIMAQIATSNVHPYNISDKEMKKVIDEVFQQRNNMKSPSIDPIVKHKPRGKEFLKQKNAKKK